MKLKCKQLPKNKDFSDTQSILRRWPLCKQFGPFYNNFMAISKLQLFTKKKKILLFYFCWNTFKSLSANFQWHFNFSLKRFLLRSSLCVWPSKSWQFCRFPVNDSMMMFTRKQKSFFIRTTKIRIMFVLSITDIIVMFINLQVAPHLRVRQLVIVY